jgi:signal transduction histidine kinase
MTSSKQEAEKINHETFNLSRDQKEYITLLEKLMAFISHDIRKHVAHVLGLSCVMKSSSLNPEQLNEKLLDIKHSATSLDTRTRELSASIYKKILSLKKAEEGRVIQKPIIR